MKSNSFEDALNNPIGSFVEGVISIVSSNSMDSGCSEESLSLLSRPSTSSSTTSNNDDDDPNVAGVLPNCAVERNAIKHKGGDYNFDNDKKSTANPSGSTTTSIEGRSSGSSTSSNSMDDSSSEGSEDATSGGSLSALPGALLRMNDKRNKNVEDNIYPTFTSLKILHQSEQQQHHEQQPFWFRNKKKIVFITGFIVLFLLLMTIGFSIKKDNKNYSNASPKNIVVKNNNSTTMPPKHGEEQSGEDGNKEVTPQLGQGETTSPPTSSFGLSTTSSPAPVTTTTTFAPSRRIPPPESTTTTTPTVPFPSDKPSSAPTIIPQALLTIPPTTTTISMTTPEPSATATTTVSLEPSTSQPTTSVPSEKPTSLPTTSYPSSLSPSAAPTTSEPSLLPSAVPSTPSPSTPYPTDLPSADPTTALPTSLPSSSSPSATPSNMPSTTTAPSTSSPTTSPTITPTITTPLPTTSTPITSTPTDNDFVTYRPGNLTEMHAGLLLSEGLMAREIATSGRRVLYANGQRSSKSFHDLPDGGETFWDTRPDNPGGWIYVSNSEMRERGEGGVGAITFDKDGNILKYQMVLEGSTMNCGGGSTPWGTWISCEELEFYGQIYQVDPTGQREPQVLTLGSGGGRWEAFAYDVRNLQEPHFFASEDHNRGCVRRFTPDPSEIDWENDPWSMLHGEGVTDYLILHPEPGADGGTFEWSTDRKEARRNAVLYYPQTEGIDCHENQLFFVCKNIRQIFTVNLDEGTYTNATTVTGLFDGKPDQMQRILDDPTSILYFTEEGGKDAGVHARDFTGGYYTILEGPNFSDETSGLAFSPDAMHMYIAFQQNGRLFDVWRQDGLPFNARRLDVKYHGLNAGRY